MAKKSDNDKEKNLRAAAKVAKKVAPSKSQVRKVVKKSGFHRAVPYILIILSIVAGLFLAFGKNAGELGIGVNNLFRGSFGGAGYLIPFGLFFVGIIWCILHFKETSPKRYSDEDGAPDLRRARRRTISKTILVFLFIVLFSIMLGVIEDPLRFDMGKFWDNGAARVWVGGSVGSSIGWALNSLMAPAISIVLLSILLLIVFCFIIGLTPDYIINTVRLRREARAEQIEIDEEAEARKYELMRQKELERRKKKVLKEREAEQKRALRAEYEDYDDEPELAPVAKPAKKKAEKKQSAPVIDDTDELLSGIGVDDEPIDEFSDPEPQALDLGDEAPTQKSANTGVDYGGDSVIDGDTVNLDDLLKETASAEPQPESAPAPAPTADLELGEISNEDLSEDLVGVAPEESSEPEEEIVTPYIFPTVDMLSPNKNPIDTDVTAELQENARILKETLKSFKVDIREINYSRGPTITRYELKPEVGTRVRSIANLVDDIALSLATSGVRIEAPIPNKPAVGIEVPNRNRATVYLRDLIENSKFTDAKSRITSCLGMDVGGNPVYFDVGKMPHLLIAGTTGSGKSVCINTIILSILYKARPDEVKLILIDPKQVEFTVYENIPHLYCPIVSEPKKAAGALASAVSEMERRFELIKSVGVRNIESYNEVTANDPDKEYMPKMVIIIDELADLMMTARDEVETSICRLAQKARAAGIHVILGTQRPSVDVITGLIKANVPSRIACTVTSQVDSRTIIDVAGAENLIGYGDMLFAPVGAAKPMRVQGAFVSDPEVEKIVTFIKENNSAVKYNSDFINSMEENAKLCGMSKKQAAAAASDADGGAPDGGDSKFSAAVKLAIEEGKISTSLMQRRLGVGYGRAAKIIDTMEEKGYVSKPDGNKPRRVLITMQEYMDRTADGSLGGEE